MMPTSAKNADDRNVYSGNGRRYRKRRLENARRRSHYRYAIWLKNEAGMRMPAELDFNSWSRQRASIYLLGVREGHIPKEEWLYSVRHAEANSNVQHTDLIHTTYHNKSTGTQTCHSIAFDWDYGKAADAYKKGGRLDWGEMYRVLQEREPVIARCIGEVAWSTSGKGLGVTIPISPIELGTPGAGLVEDMARKLQKRLIRIFNYYGFGSDPNALGLSRWMPNFHNPKKFVDINDLARRRAEIRRDQVIRELLNATDDHPSLDYIPKKSHVEDFIYHYEPVEAGLSKLYLHLLEDVGLHDSMQISIKSLSEWIHVSDKTLRKIFKQGLCWLNINHIGGREGYRLTIRPTLALTSRARSISNGKKPKSTEYKPMRRLLVGPSEVQDGDRYDWRGNVLLCLKLIGVQEQTAVQVLENLRDQVPGGNTSRTLTRNLRAGVRSFWTKRLFDKHGVPVLGSRPNMPIPDWLDSVVIEVQAEQARKHFPRKDPLRGPLSFARLPEGISEPHGGPRFSDFAGVLSEDGGGRSQGSRVRAEAFPPTGTASCRGV